MARTIPIMLVCWLSLGLAAFPFDSSAISASKTYRECAEKVRANPQSAFKEAEQWAREANTPSAQHCYAMALFALKRYGDAARQLEKLSIMVGDSNLTLWANILRQTGRAWELADDNTRAITVLTKAIARTAERGITDPVMGRVAADLLTARGRLHGKGGRDLYAIQDLDHALTLKPGHEEALLTRAAVFIARDEWQLARSDLHLLLNTQPNHAEALRLMQRLP